jgi:hypothetical protein
MECALGTCGTFRLRCRWSFDTISAQLETAMNSFLHRVSIIVGRVRLRRLEAGWREAAS